MYLTVRYTLQHERGSYSKLEFGPPNINRYVVTPQVDFSTSTLLLELLQCRDGSLTLSKDNFSTTDIAAMIDILCVKAYVLTITCASDRVRLAVL